MLAGGIQDIYPLTPLQRGLLFHAVSDSRAGMYVEQLNLRLRGEIDLDAFEGAWELASARHPGLRTGFVWQDLDEPMQVVLSDVRIAPTRLDWRQAPAAEQERLLAEFLRADRETPFDPADAPLLRITVIRLTDATSQVICTNHHLILDGWSRSVLFADVMTAYEALRQGAVVQLPPAAPYRSYVEWLRTRPLDTAEQAWRALLTGLATPTPLPVDAAPGRPEPGARAPDQDGAASVTLSLDAPTTARLTAACRAHGITLATVTQAAWGLLLARHAGISDVLFGTVAAGRPAGLGLERSVGLFLNTVPARVRIDPKRPVLEWLRQAQVDFAESREHAHLPLSRIAACSDFPPGTSLFDTLVVVENYPIQAASDARVTVEHVEVAERTDVALTLVVAPEDRLHLRLVYDTGRCHRAGAERLLDELRTLLAAIAEDTAQPVGQLPLISVTESQRLVAAWNPAGTRELAVAPLISRFRAHAEHAPDAVALVDGDRSVTYRALFNRAGALAARLRAAGAGRDSVVGVLLVPGLDQVVALLGIQLAGAAYLPVDPSYPAARIGYLLDDSGAQLVVTGADHIEVGAGRRAITVTGSQSAIPFAGADPAPDDLAYVIYTSGSTGRPKGVLIPHRQAARLFSATEDWFHFGPADTWTLFHSASFDFSVWEMWGALAHGGRLVVVAEDVRRAPAEFLDLLGEQAVTVLNQTPSAFYALSALVGERLALPALRTVIFGGEALDLDRLTGWIDRFGDARPQLVNMYGITETTVHVTWQPITGAEVLAGAGSLIGTPIPDLRVYLLDAALRPVPVGVLGEIHVGGAGLARGYLGRPGLTADRFVPDPFSPDPGARLYRTGDLATSRADGTLVYARRGDDQVKIRGYRIELAEVAAALRACPEVRDGVVIVREDVPGEPRLVGYALAADHGPDGAQPDGARFVAAVRAGLAARLPRHMLPTAIVPLKQLPLTPHGKLDRAALPAPGGDRGTLPTAYAEPRGPVETTLSRIWTEVLHRPSVGRDDNFFALGGDSIQSMQIALRAGRAGVQLSPRQLFAHQTIAELARVAVVEAPSAQAPDDLADRTGPVPLTPIQRWFFDQDRLQPAHFNQALLLRSDRAGDEATLRAALVGLVRSHDALRLAFTRTADGWQAQVREPHDLDPLTVVDLAHLSGAEVRAAVVEECDRVLRDQDLGSGLLLRASLMRCGAAGDRLLLSAHHLGIDAVSWPIVLEALAPSATETAEPAPSFSWRRWALALADYAEDPALADELGYWTELVEATPAALPCDGPGGVAATGTARTIERELDAEVTSRLLHEVPAASRAELLDVLHAAVGRTLTEWTNTATVLVDIESHGRQPMPHAPNPISGVGWFTALHPLALSGGSPSEALAAAVRARRRVPGLGLGYGLLRYLRGDEATAPLRRAPRPDALINYLGRLDSSLPPAGAEPAAGTGTFPAADPAAGTAGPAWRPADEDPGSAQNQFETRHHDHEITAGVVAGTLRLRWSYSPERTRPETIERLADRLLHHLGEIAGSAVRGELAPAAAEFPLSGLDDAALAELLAATGPLADLYPLSPMQEGMLFHLAYAEGTGVNVEQVSCQITGKLEPEVFRLAWERLTQRHAVLRTSFHWRSLARPLQAVHVRAELPWTELDWREATPTEQQRRLDRLLIEDRSAPIRPERAPLARVTLVRLADDRHWLLWTHHHLLLDGWSLARLLPELMLHYRAAVQGTRHEPAPRPPYRDYIEWLERQDGSAADALWRRMLADISSPTALPAVESADHSPSGPAGAALKVIELSADQTATLTRFAREHQLTVNTLVQAAWALLLHRHSGERDVVFGSVVSGRPASLAGAEDMIGQFINTIPVRATISPGRPVADWLRALQDDLADARDHEYVPLVRIHGCSGVPRDQPLFETVVVFENYSVERAVQPIDPAAAGNDEVTIEELRGVEQTNYPLTLIAAPGSRLRLQVLYDPARYQPGTARRLGRQVQNALLSLAASAERPVAEVELLDAAERSEALALGADSSRPLEPSTSLLSVFAAQVARRPEAPALLSGAARLSYADLDEAADRFARRLHAAGVGRGDVVAIFGERSVDLIVAVLGTFQAGAAYVPVDTALGTERVRYLLTDSAARVVVCSAADRRLLPDVGATIIEFEDTAEPGLPPEQAETRTDRFRPEPHELAYLIYTSGSTGLPKGAMVEHRGMINHLLAKVEDLQLGPDDVVAATASPSFDISVWQFFSALLVGATTRIYDDDTARDPRELIAATEADGVTVLELVPSMLRAVLDSYAEPSARPALSRLRWLLLTGEALPPDLAASCLQRWPRLALMNAYGPTECSDDVTHQVLRRPPAADAARVPIGSAIRNTRLYVLDAFQQPVPLGAAGELCVGGAGVGRGYRSQPGRTAAVFVPDPYSDSPGARLYRTGDRVRRLPDGTLDFLGRLDHQVKVRGFRIELGEIETTLLAHPGVSDATVLLREDTVGDQRLVAYVVAADPSDELIRDLRAHCERSLAAYAMPAAILPLPGLPLTPNGKLDRKALPAPHYADAPAGEPPRPGIEEQVAAVWREVLGVDQLDRQANFFALGGHSLLAMRVIATLPSAGVGEVGLRELFEAPTLAAFSRRALAHRARELADSGPVRDADPAAGVRRRPLSFAQQRLWFLDRWESGSSVYNLPTALRLAGALDPAALAQALQRLSDRHESLRTTFGTDGEDAYQQVHPRLDIALPVLDLSTAVDPERSAHQLAVSEAGRPFDLGTGPLLRAVLLRLGPADHVLLLTVHHIVSDGWSSAVMLRDLGEFYAAMAEGREPRLPELAVQYADYAVWQRTLLGDDLIQSEVEHWRQVLAGAPALLELPTDRPRPEVQAHHGANLRLSWPRELSEAVQQFAGQESLTTFMVLLAAVAATLGRHSRQDDVVIGTPVAGRSHRALDDLVGFFVNTLPLRADLGGDPTLRELVRRSRDSALDAFAHQELPFERLVEGLAPPRTLSASPLFQVMLVLHNLPPVETGLSAPGLGVQRFGEDVLGTTARFDLTISLREEDGLQLNVEYDTALFDRDTVHRLLEHIRRLLAEGLAAPDTPVADLDLAGPAERAGITSFGAGAEVAGGDRERTVVQLLERQVNAAPDAIAVVDAGGGLTYRGLWARASTLAERLRAAGAGPGTLIELGIDASAALVIALVAGLRTGAAVSCSRLPGESGSSPAGSAELLPYLSLAYQPARSDADPWQLSPQGEPAGPDAPPLNIPALGVPALGVPALSVPALSVPALGVPALGVPALGAPALVTADVASSAPGAGLVTTHRALSEQLAWLQEQCPLTAGDRFLATPPAAIDLLRPLVAGAQLVLAGTAGLGDDLAGLGVVLDANGITAAQVEPSALAALALPADGPRPNRLRRLTFHGAEPAADLVLAALAAFPGVELHRLYRAPGTAAFVAAAAYTDVASTGTVGRPATNSRLAVLDRRLRPCPLGVLGELYVAGAQNAEGFRGRPGLTAARFVPDPSGPPGARMVRTGDLGYWRPDGTLRRLGQAEAAGRRSGGSTSPGVTAPATLSSLGADAGQHHDRSSTPTEERLLALWRQVLGVEQIGLHDDFFAIGGHSLLAMKVQSRVLATFGATLPLRRLFELPTVAELAAEIDRGSTSAAAPDAPPAAARIGRIDRSAYRRR